MATITEDYVSFEIAKLLKDKGFDARCPMIYTADGEMLYTDVKHHNMYAVTNKQLEYYTDIIAPTHQMAMAWLRIKHIIIVVCPEYFNVDGICSYWGIDIWVGDNYEKLQGDYPSYEESVESALKYCLENLI